MSATLPGGSTRVEVRHVRRTLGLGALVWIMFFTVSGGPYGLEDTIGESGAEMGLLLIPAGGDGAWGGRPRPPTLVAQKTRLEISAGASNNSLSSSSTLSSVRCAPAISSEVQYSFT